MCGDRALLLPYGKVRDLCFKQHQVMGKTWAPSNIDIISRMEKSVRLFKSNNFWWVPETLSLCHSCGQEKWKTDIPPPALAVPVTKAEMHRLYVQVHFLSRAYHVCHGKWQFQTPVLKLNLVFIIRKWEEMLCLETFNFRVFYMSPKFPLIMHTGNEQLVDVTFIII